MHGVGKISDIFAGCDVDESFPTKSNVDGINKIVELLQTLDDGFVFTNLVETDQLWGHRNDPVNFHRCLQDFDRRLEDILEALRPGDLLILTSDHGCDPTTPSTDHSREHALLLAYAAGRNAGGAVHDGRVRRRRCHRERLARRQGAGAWHPGLADPDAVSLNDPATVAAEYASERGLLERRDAYRYAEGTGRAVRSRSRRCSRSRPGGCSRSGCGPGEAAAAIAASGAGVVALDISERMVELARARGVDARVGDAQELPVRGRELRLRARRLDALPRARARAGLAELARVLRPGGRLVAVTNGRAHLQELRELLRRLGPTRPSTTRTGRAVLARHFSHVEERDAVRLDRLPRP